MPSIEVEYIPTNSILRHPRNPKKHPEEQIHRLEASIQKFGWTSPIILSSDGYILAGHARYEAALNQGIGEVPCIRTALNGDDAIAYLLADNALASDEWDMEQLKGLFDELPDDLSCFTGIDDNWFDDLDGGLEEFDGKTVSNKDNLKINADENVITDIKLGDVFDIGSIKLMCGDSSNEEHIKKLIANNNPDLLFLDPPYEMDHLWELDVDFSKAIVFSDSKHIKSAMKTAMKYKYIYEFIWDTILSWYVQNRPICRHRSAFVCMNEPHYNSDACVINDGKQRKSSKRKTNLGEYTYSPIGDGNVRLTTVFQFGKNNLPAQHGKPLEWITPLIAGCGAESVFEPFGGFGSTAMACLQLGIPCYIMEINPKRVQLILNRIKEY